MWRLPDDTSQAVITAAEHIQGAQGGEPMRLPPTAIVCFMGRGTDYLAERYQTREFPKPLPRFLNRCPLWELEGEGICFLDGGRGAPQAADTVETLAALGVQNILAVGMCGAFSESVRPGEVIAPPKAFIEEGTSLHYLGCVDASFPEEGLFYAAASLKGVSAHPIVSTDAVYRQTFQKERLWREKGAVAVDMVTSAVFSVARYLGLKAAALLMVSDIHPAQPDAPKWAWRMTGEMRHQLVEKSVALARRIAHSNR